MLIEQFEDVIAWQKARKLTSSVYKQFKECKDYGFRDQICRAAVSIMNNIAEGSERQTKKELKQFLYIAKGSCAEVRSMLHLANDLMYISPNQYKQLQDGSIEIAKILSGLIKTL
ncbi:MAG: four helix bundle protein [Desulfobulbaceae bacterium]